MYVLMDARKHFISKYEPSLSSPCSLKLKNFLCKTVFQHEKKSEILQMLEEQNYIILTSYRMQS